MQMGKARSYKCRRCAGALAADDAKEQWIYNGKDPHAAWLAFNSRASGQGQCSGLQCRLSKRDFLSMPKLPFDGLHPYSLLLFSFPFHFIELLLLIIAFSLLLRAPAFQRRIMGVRLSDRLRFRHLQRVCI